MLRISIHIILNNAHVPIHFYSVAPRVALTLVRKVSMAKFRHQP